MKLHLIKTLLAIVSLALSLNATAQGGKVGGKAPKTSTRISDVTPTSESGVAASVETAYGFIDGVDEDGKTTSQVTKVKPALSFESEDMKWSAFVPMSWIESEYDPNSGKQQNKKYSNRIVGRPDLSGRAKFMDDRLSAGLGVKLPMFSTDEKSTSMRDLFRTWQVYTRGTVTQPMSGGVSVFADAGLAKDFDAKYEQKIGDKTVGTTTWKRGLQFTGAVGAQVEVVRPLKVGADLRGIYGLEKDKSVMNYPAYGVTERSDMGTSKYSALEVFGNLDLSDSFSARGTVSKGLTKNADESSLVINNFEELDHVADLAASISLIGRF
jgi:hypothetical protein